MYIDIMSGFFSLEISGNIQSTYLLQYILPSSKGRLCLCVVITLGCHVQQLFFVVNLTTSERATIHKWGTHLWECLAWFVEGESTPTLDQWIRKILTFDPDFVSERHLRFRTYLLLEAYIMLWTKEVFVLCLFAILFLASLLLHCY